METPERDVITAPVPTVALLEAARAMNEPEPPADLGLYRALERRSQPSDDAPRSAPRSQPARPLAEELGLDHLLVDDFRPRPGWLSWLRAHAVWVLAALVLGWLIVSFAGRWLGTPGL